MKKVHILFTIFVLLTSCVQNTKKYKVKVLNDLKSSDDFNIFLEYTPKVWVLDYLYVTLTYDSSKNDMVVSEILNIKENKVEENNLINYFISTYFLISSEKMKINFPVEIVNTYKCSFPSKLIAIEKFDTENDKTKNNYHKFEYKNSYGFLILHNYCYFTNGYIDTSDGKITLVY